MKRETRAKIASETLDILSTGSYTSPAGIKVDIAPALRLCVSHTILITPDQWPAMLQSAVSSATSHSPTICVTDETSLAAAYRMAVHEKCQSLAILNFASAKNPGGGFLSGSQAQEESLARSSALYTALNTQPAYYQANRKVGGSIYTDHAIFSPAVPIFRDDEGALLPAASFITMPAVNAGAVKTGSADHPKIPQIMAHRAKCVLALAIAQKQHSLILGAWGCGVFKNDPTMIAKCFAEALDGASLYRNHFQQITFAIPDPKMKSIFEAAIT